MGARWAGRFWLLAIVARVQHFAAASRNCQQWPTSKPVGPPLVCRPPAAAAAVLRTTPGPLPLRAPAGNMDGAKIYAQNAIRKKNEALNYLRLGSRLDAVVSRLDQQAKMQVRLGGSLTCLESWTA